jgi:hypothetical protein
LARVETPMATQKQTDANRRNALLSTGPRTEEGKQQSRCNALSHGLTAETIIPGLEDAANYGAFEAEIVTEYDPKSVIERELTQRLASLLWRLRRANLIEVGLLSIPETTQELDQQSDASQRYAPRVSGALIRRLKLTVKTGSEQRLDEADLLREHADPPAHRPADRQRAMTTYYLRLANLESMPLERINRYETSLWRQFVQILFALDQAKYHRIAASRGRFIPRPPQW